MFPPWPQYVAYQNGGYCQWPSSHSWGRGLPCFDFTWSGLYEATARDAPNEVMRFGGTFYRIIRRVLMAKPRLGLVYLGKVDLANAYMQLWVRLEDTLSVELLIPRKKPTYE